MQTVVRARACWARPAALAAALLLASACAQPSVDALAVWLESDTPRLQLYDGGERREVEVIPLVEDSDTSKVQVVVAPGGAGVLIAPPNDKMVWTDVRNGGHVVLDYGVWGELDDELQVFESGAAIVRRAVDDTGVVILPLLDPVDAPLWLERPPELLPGAGFRLRSAGAAPIFYLTELAQPDLTTPNNAVAGVVRVYQLRAGGLVELDRAVLHGRGSNESSASMIPGGCPDGACVSPDGEALFMMRARDFCPPYAPLCVMPPADCRVLRYRWRAEPGHSAGSVEAIRLPDDCDYDHDGLPETPEVPRAGAPELLAALSDSVVLLADDVRIYRADLDAGTWISIPKLGTTTASSGADALSLFPVEQGRAALLLANNLQVIRADAYGLRIHSAESVGSAVPALLATGCGSRDTTVTSPNGEWLLTICLHDVGIVEFPDKLPRTVVRISPLGLERFDGIPMRALAIDDGGNALLYSFASGDNDLAPRGLYVLDAAGNLARVDTLEPSPQELTGAAEPYYFSARSRTPAAAPIKDPPRAGD
jgi:hypothetical protein